MLWSRRAPSGSVTCTPYYSDIFLFLSCETQPHYGWLPSTNVRGYDPSDPDTCEHVGIAIPLRGRLRLKADASERASYVWRVPEPVRGPLIVMPEVVECGISPRSWDRMIGGLGTRYVRKLYFGLHGQGKQGGIKDVLHNG